MRRKPAVEVEVDELVQCLLDFAFAAQVVRLEYRIGLPLEKHVRESLPRQRLQLPGQRYVRRMNIDRVQRQYNRIETGFVLTNDRSELLGRDVVALHLQQQRHQTERR